MGWNGRRSTGGGRCSRALAVALRASVLASLLLVAVLLLPAAPGNASRLHAQVPPLSDARLPSKGEVWFEIAPWVEAWHQQFAAGSEELADGSKEPLFADFDGPLLDRLYPGPGPLLDRLNAGSDSLGFTPVSEEDLSLGGLDFRDLTARRIALPLRLRIGVLDRLAVEGSLPLVATDMEAAFTFDSAGATAATASFALPDGSAFVDDLMAAREELLDQLLAGGVEPGREDEASDLVDATGAFLAVLQRKLDLSSLLPLGGSAAGEDMTQLVTEFQQEFSSFGIQAPPLALAESSTSQALQAIFTGALLQADSLTGRSVSLTPGEPTVGVRVAVLDTYADSVEGEADGLKLRTTAAARLRFATSPADRSPFHTPGIFLDVPAGDGSTDLELMALQDLAYGRFSASAAAAYGIQTADELRLRVRSPDRPFALADTERRVERDLGDYLSGRLSARFALEPAVRLSAEYAFWHKGDDSYRLLDPGIGDGGAGGDGDGHTLVESAGPLELETGETRHTVGFGVYYSASGEEGAPRARSVEVGVTYQRSLAGSGGQTPAPELLAVRFRVPFGLF